MSRRRDENEVVGWVNFPIKNPTFRNTKEGGMFVRLVVVDKTGLENYMKRWMPCCGGYQNFIMDESFIGDDYFDSTGHEDDPAFEYHFPWYAVKNDEDDNPSARYSSIDYLAIITLGATGWSGWNKILEAPWVCTYDDLTEEGKALYNQFKKLYPGSTLFLQTWLDT